MADSHEYFGEDVLTTGHGIFASTVGMGKQHPPENSEVEDGHLQKGDRLLLPGMGPLQLQ